MYINSNTTFFSELILHHSSKPYKIISLETYFFSLIIKSCIAVKLVTNKISKQIDLTMKYRRNWQKANFDAIIKIS